MSLLFSEAELDEVLQKDSGKLVVLMASMTWCRPCKGLQRPYQVTRIMRIAGVGWAGSGRIGPGLPIFFDMNFAGISHLAGEVDSEKWENMQCVLKGGKRGRSSCVSQSCTAGSLEILEMYQCIRCSDHMD